MYHVLLKRKKTGSFLELSMDSRPFQMGTESTGCDLKVLYPDWCVQEIWGRAMSTWYLISKQKTIKPLTQFRPGIY
jgi:hypothetical protein